MRTKLFVLIGFASLSGCAGDMTGQVRGTGERIAFSYEQGIGSDKYAARIGDENFSGKAIMDGSTSGFGTAYGGGTNTSIFGSTSTNRFVAVLLGDKGSSLNCQMRYADSSGMTNFGGVGVCQHSDGRIIDVVW